MDLVHRKVFWGRRKSRLGGEEAGSECGQILLAEPQGHPRQQPRGHPLNLRRITGFLKGLHTNKGPQNVIPLDETSQGMGIVFASLYCFPIFCLLTRPFFQYVRRATLLGVTRRAWRAPRGEGGRLAHHHPPPHDSRHGAGLLSARGL